MVRSSQDEEQVARNFMVLIGRLLQVSGWIMIGIAITGALVSKSSILLIGTAGGFLFVIIGTGYRAWAKRDIPVRPPWK